MRGVEGPRVRKDRERVMRVLVIEDFEVLATAIGSGLRREGMAVDVALDGHGALEHLAVTRYDVVVLDRDLPGVHGDEVCRQIVAGGPGVARHLQQIGPMTAGLEIQASTGLRSLPIGPWAGLGVLAAWAVAALLAGALVLRLRDA